VKGRLTGRGEIVEDIALLLAQGVTDGEHAFDETAAIRAVSAETGVPPQDSMAQGSLGVVVGGLDAWLTCEGPQRRLDGEQIAASGRRLGVGELLTTPQLQIDLGPQMAELGSWSVAGCRHGLDATR